MGVNWSKTAADGSPRSMVSQIIDPVGACIQPAELTPWNPDAYEESSEDVVPTSAPAPAPQPTATAPKA